MATCEVQGEPTLVQGRFLASALSQTIMCLTWRADSSHGCLRIHAVPSLGPLGNGLATAAGLVHGPPQEQIAAANYRPLDLGDGRNNVT